ncbi:Protein white [Thelohanellus kitauei]|uniref:Protein white n=1 Tax=Thelohanellus kitauei TaxID=669202 RepID=A0A0C2JRT8_THEKT|nr:Protein white [Thelohanellus kitauei]
MGESGSGKTTLLNTLSGQRSRQMKVNGDIKINGMDLDVRSIAAYVEQNDLFIPTLTVYEHLMFTGTLVLGQKLSKSEIKEKVNEVIASFSLNTCRNTQIGCIEKGIGISGGQRRRLSIASQIMANPRIIFLDEPTSGLDSHTAETGFTCPTNFNPADFFIETIAVRHGKEKEHKEITQASQDTGQVKTELKAEVLFQSKQGVSHVEFSKIEKKKMATVSAQFRSLLLRSWRSTVRNPVLFKMRVFQIIIISIIFGLIYLRLENSTENIYNFAGAMFGITSNTTFGGVMGVIFVIPAELAVFRREHSKGLYYTWIYFVTKTLVDIPVFTLMPSIMILITYFMIGFNQTVKSYFSFWLTLVLVSLVATSFGYLISALTSKYETASALAAPLMIPFMIFGGFMIRTKNIPIYFAWISYISWFRYGFDVFVSSQFTDTELICNSPVSFNCDSVRTVPGSAAIQALGISDFGLTINVVALLSLLVGFRILGLIALEVKTRLNER